MSNLLEKSVNAEPVGVIYNFKTSLVDEWVYNVLTNKFKIDGIDTVKTSVTRGGKTPEIAVYVFIKPQSANLKSNTHRIPEHIRKKMEEGVYTADNNLKSALMPLCDKFKLGTTKGLVFCKLNIFKVLGAMVAVNPREHTISILEINKMKKDSIITVLKSMKFVHENNGGDGDKYLSLIHI